MRNRQRCEINRRERLKDKADIAFSITNPDARAKLISAMRECDDWKRSTRATHAYIEGLMEAWRTEEEFVKGGRQ